MSIPIHRAETRGARAANNRRLARSSLGTGAGTIVSRLTGMLRLTMTAAALGGGKVGPHGVSLGDPFNLANNTPNMIHDLVLGGILAATFVPVFVDRFAKRPHREAVESISAVVTLALVVLVIGTVLFVVAAPQIIDLYTVGSKTFSASERSLSIELLRLFAPQLLFYGVISLISAVLATHDRFVGVGLAPIVNNVIGIAVLGAFWVISSGRTVASIQGDTGLITFLGIGTTLGVALQAVALIPSMRRSGVRLHFVWRPRDPAMRTIIGLSGWTFGFVIANQFAVFFILALASHTNGGISAYTYAFTFFQFPFAVVAVSIVNVATPDFARAFEQRDLALLGERFGHAARQVFALILPAMVGYLLLAQPAITLALQYHLETAGDARQTASTLAMFSLGLPGYCLYFLSIRAFQAMQDTRTAFVLYVLENATNIIFAIVLLGPLGVRGLALSYSIAYTVAAIFALAVLRERLGSIGGARLLTAGLRSVLLSVVMAVVVAFLLALFGSGGGIGGAIRLIFVVVVGLAVYISGAGFAATAQAWQNSRRTRSRAPRRILGPYQGRHR